MNLKPLIAAVAFSLTASAFAYDSLEALMLDMTRKQVEAIKTYIAENPEADDLDEARSQLVYGFVSQDDYAGALQILEGMYDGLPADKSELDLGMAFGEIVVPMIQLYRMDGQEETAAGFIAKVREEFAGHAMIDTINEALDEFSRMFEAPGQGDTLEIAFTALDGREVDLAAMKGKVVLVDFWATWCVPCLRAMPDIKALYNDFHDRGFEIIGISLDSEKQKLQDYIEKEGLAWPQYFDGKGWDNEIAATYGIQSIPATFLIGPDGTVVLADAAPAQIRATIEELLPKGE